MTRDDIPPAADPRLRVDARVLLRNEDGAVLLVKPPQPHEETRYGWQLPGGETRAGEFLADAAARGLRADTGIVCQLRRTIALDQVPASGGGRTGSLIVVFDGGLLTGDPAAIVRVPQDASGDLSRCQWAAVKELRDHCREHEERRIVAAVRAAGELGQDNEAGLLVLLLGASI